MVRNDPNSAGPKMTPEEREEMIGKYMAWVKSLEPGGHQLSGEKLRDKQGRVLWRKEKLVVTDGPYTETKEIVGGFWLIKADSYDHAVEIADGLPFGKGALEIREIEE
jgi:hypothetical protein